jgi:hypothetical protein
MHAFGVKAVCRAILDVALPLGEEAHGPVDGEAAEQSGEVKGHRQQAVEFRGTAEPEHENRQDDEETVVSDDDGAAAALGFNGDEDEETARGCHCAPPDLALALEFPWP